MMRNLLVKAIELYQATLSPDHGPLRHIHPHGYCPHEPTCSDYAKKQISKKGILAFPSIGKRLLSCHPWKKPSKEKIMKVTENSSL